MSTAAVFDALGDATRREIVRLLADEPRSVGDLADRLPVSRPAVSQHLRVLADGRAGRRSRPRGRVASTGSTPPAPPRLASSSTGCGTPPLDRFADLAERTATNDRQETR